jgi:cob(I)alamin adenosyltransferase
MVKLSKLYTKNGDAGKTHLVGGDEIEKASLKVSAYGDIDELNASLGVIRTLAKDKPLLQTLIAKIQNELFDIGSILATRAGYSWEGMRVITEENILFLENQIDSCIAGIPELKSFVIPGGTILNAELHRARTVCRRAERSIWSLKKIEEVDSNITTYINRLSDLLFALSRKESFDSGTPEYLWE